MLAADKLQLQSAVKQQATALKEKEFNLHHSNMMTVGTQAAVLAGLNTTMFIEFTPAPYADWGEAFLLIPRVLKFFYYISIVSAFCANIMVVAQTSLVSVTATSLALRGPDGSMMTATDGLYEERKSVFQTFGYGLGATVSSVIISVWLSLHPETAAICMGITIFTAYRMYNNFKRVSKKFAYDESETVDFNDIFSGPAAITAVWGKSKNHEKSTFDDLSSFRHCQISTDSLMEEGKQSWSSFLSSNRKIEHPHNGELKMTDKFFPKEKSFYGKIGQQRRRRTCKSKQFDYEYDSDCSRSNSSPLPSPRNISPSNKVTVV
jgi:hypothetical protein